MFQYKSNATPTTVAFSLTSFSAFLLACTPYTKQIERLFVVSGFIGGFSFDPFSIFVWALGIAILVLRRRIERSSLWVLLAILLVCFISWANAMLLTNNFGRVIQQAVGVLVAALGSLSIVRAAGAIKCFTNYILVSVWVSYIGLVQFCLHILFSFNIHLRTEGAINSVAPEPSHLAIALAPAFLYSLLSDRTSYKHVILFGTTLALTVSATGILLISCAMLLYALTKRFVFAIFAASLAGAVVIISYLFVPDFTVRIDSVIEHLVTPDLSSGHATSYSIVSNLRVALHVLQNHPFGTGLGGHLWAYDSYLLLVSPEAALHHRLGINSQGGHSLWIRLISELGWMSIGLMLGFGYLVFRLLSVRIAKSVTALHASGLACVIYFIGRAFKLGGYFDYGLWFFASVLIVSGTILLRRVNRPGFSRHS